jgi:predicted metal-dependent hydrolase
VRDFVGHHRQWIDRKVSQLQPSAALHSLAEGVPTRIDLAASGESFAVVWTMAARSRHDESAGTIHIQAPDVLQARRQLRIWLMRAAPRRLEPSLLQMAADWQMPLQRASVRRQRTRWGSCSVRGTISLNCCLVFQDPQIVRYLFAHELAHLRHMNHSEAFWALVERIEPDYKRLDKELLSGWSRVPAWIFGS